MSILYTNRFLILTQMNLSDKLYTNPGWGVAACIFAGWPVVNTERMHHKTFPAARSESARPPQLFVVAVFFLFSTRLHFLFQDKKPGIRSFG
jgi:hypothetical protein